MNEIDFIKKSAKEDITQKVEDLDLTLFDAIPSQTSIRDRKALLAVQRAIAHQHEDFVYLEIGSHLGGTIQPYIQDPRCIRIYSIDPRPLQQPDDRQPGFIYNYEDNSTDRMLNLLEEISPLGIIKIHTFEVDASQISTDRITPLPHIAFIDGEHTNKAALSDFDFCNQVISPDGVILFHDFPIIYPAMLHILKGLKTQGKKHLPIKLSEQVFGIFYDDSLVRTDSFLAHFHRWRRFLWISFRIRSSLLRVLPNSWVNGYVSLKSKVFSKIKYGSLHCQ